jgi:NAD(P)-dependent dehydrogenase (short-subunit alcohol dehydrogenase family)
MTQTRTALVTGAARRIGRVIALDLARHGWNVAIHCHTSMTDAENLAAEIRALGRQACVVVADLTRHDQVAAMVPAASAALGPLDLLVNNASLFERESWDSVTEAGWDAHVDANLKAPFFLAQAFARQAPAGSNIVNLLDTRLRKLTPLFVSYTVAKAGLWTLTQTLAMALAPRIRVNGIGPGPVMKNTHQTDAHFARQQALTPLKRGGTADEIAATVRYIVDMPSLTGQMILLDGGQHLPWPPAPDLDA